MTPPQRWSPTIKIVVGVILFVMAALFVYALRKVLAPLIIAAIIAYLMYPLANGLSRLVRIKHELATVIVYLALLALLAPVIALLVPVLVEQVRGFQGELIGFLDYAETLSTRTIVILPGLELAGQELINEATTALRTGIRHVAGESIDILVGASKTLLLIILTVFIAFYLTADAQKFIDGFKRLGPATYQTAVKKLLAQINGIWGDFFRGQVILAFVVTLIITGISMAIGLPYPLLMGILAGLLEFLVSIGHTIWLIVALALALVEGSTYLPVSNVVFALIVVATNLLFTKVDLNFLIPNIVGHRVNLHPIVVLIGIIVGANLAGVLGIALAAPTIATLRVLGHYVHAMMFDLDPFEQDAFLFPSIDHEPVPEEVLPTAETTPSLG